MSDGRVIVVGGGLAGIATALRCADAGAEVTLVEVRPRLGGAAYSFRRDGLWLDNGQHVFLRCCTSYRELFARLGCESAVTLQDRLSIPVLAPGGRAGRLARGRLPAPLHLGPALALYPFLTARERLGAARAALALRRLAPGDPALDEQTFGAWLAGHGQSATAVDALWDLIARPALNLPAAEASLAPAAFVFRHGLLEARGAGDLGFARVPLSDIHDGAARAALASAGVDVRVRWRAERIVARGGRFEVHGPGDEVAESEAVVLAVPHDRAGALLPTGAVPDRDRLAALGRSPIVNLHVLYDRRVTEVPFAAGVRSPVQWVFDRTASSGAREGQLLAVSLSAAVAEAAMPEDELVARFVPALAALLPGARGARVEQVWVTREHAATFRAAPGTERLRPGTRTALPGLLLAGAWTATGWPATMESAVRSGRAAADEALATLETRGRPGARRDGDEALAAAEAPRPRPARREGEQLLVLAPLRIEGRAVRRGAPAARVVRSGMGARRSREAAAGAREMPAAAVAVMGFCGAVAEGLVPGDLVVASELRGPGGRVVPCPAADLLTALLRRAGLRAHRGPLVTVPRLVRGAQRARLAAEGALAADLESAWLAAAAGPRPLAVVRAVVDTPGRELMSPATPAGAGRACDALARAAPVLAAWAAAARPRRVLLGVPRAFCAGVGRAIDVVERELAAGRGGRVYVRRHIVHNAHVVADFRRRGVVFVDEVDDVPPGATVVLSAHGVAPAVRAGAARLGLRVVDATCPLVNKVHGEARRYTREGYTVVLVGHAGHDEVVGTLGEAPDRIRLVETLDDVEDIDVDDPERVAYLTQTTLAVDETREIVAALRRRFPRLVGPRTDDICFAAQNRQDAVKALARECDALLVAGSRTSSNSQRLVEVAQRAGCPARLVDDESDLDLAWLAGARTVGLTAGASAPEEIVRRLLRALEGLGRIEVSERAVTRETTHFKLPVEVP